MRAVLSVFAAVALSLGGPFSTLIPVEYPWEYEYKHVAELSDGSIAVTIAMIMEDPVVLQFSPEGELIRENASLSVPGRGLEGGGWVVPSSAGGCYVVAYSEPRATGRDSDVAVFRLDRDLQEEWCHMVGENSDLVFRCMGAAGSSDGGCAFLHGEGYLDEGFDLTVLNAEGEVCWNYLFPTEPEVYSVAVNEVPGGNLVFLLHSWEQKAFLQKINPLGELEWSCEIPERLGYGPAASGATGYGYGLYCSSPDDTRSGCFVTVDEYGNLMERVFIDHGIRVQSVSVEEDRIVFAGSRSIDGEQGAVLEGWSFAGTELWSRRMDAPGEQQFNDMFLCEDGGYLLLGYSISDEGLSGTVLVRTGPIEDTDALQEGEIPFPAELTEAVSVVPGWVIACGVFSDEDTAYELACEVRESADYGWQSAAWIPDWPSLSGYEGWLACVEAPVGMAMTDEQVAVIREICPDAYMVWVGVEKPEESFTLESYSASP